MRAQAALEMALVAPVLITLIVGIVDCGKYFEARQSVVTAAHNGVLYSTLYPMLGSTADPAPRNTIEGQVQSEGGVTIHNVSTNIQVIYYNATGSTICATYTVAGGFAYQNGGSAANCVLAGNLIGVSVTYAYTPFLTTFIPVFNKSLTITTTEFMMESV